MGVQRRANDESGPWTPASLIEVLGVAGVGVWSWDLRTDDIVWVTPGSSGVPGPELRFQSSAEFVALARCDDRADLAEALRRVAGGTAVLRHTFRLERDDRCVVGIEGKRFGDGPAGHVIGISRDDSDRVDAEDRMSALFDERDRVARALETALLPPVLPPVPGLSVDAAYRSSEGAATGDFYDLFPVGDGGWALSIGDVGGHGPSAAAITTAVRYSLRAAALVRRNPSRVLRAANQAHLAAAQDERFTTCHFVLLRRTARGVRLRIATAGHPDLLVRRVDGTVERVSGSGPMLGLTSSPEFVEAKALLGVADVLVAHTDGVTEARRGGELFGDERVASFLRGWSGPVEGFAAALHREADAFNDGPTSDDMATVVLRVEDAPEGEGREVLG